MKQVERLEELRVTIEKEIVFRLLDCRKDSPVYEELEDAYAGLLEHAYALCKPEGVMAAGVIPSGYLPDKDGEEQEAVFVLVTIGQGLSDYSTQAFLEGDYVNGMLADAMADAALFSLERGIQEQLRRYCVGWKRGIKRRLEAPQDIAMEIQKEVFAQTRAGELLGMELSAGYMFRPIKTSSQIYLTTTDEKVFRAQHNCRTCSNLTCSLRRTEPLKIEVQSFGGMEKQRITYMEGTLLDTLREQMKGIQAPCGGRGSCGKCRIQILEGKAPVLEEDRHNFSEKELKAGWRLACQVRPVEDLRIRIGWQNESAMEVQTIFTSKSSDLKTEWAKRQASSNFRCYGMAIDIGTTTVVLQLIELETGKIVDTWSSLNSQRVYGADVIARIQADIEGKGELLRRCILGDLQTGMKELCKRTGISWKEIIKIAAVGNTAMLHLLLGYSCEGLGSMPFTPYDTGAVRMEAKQLFPNLPEEVSLEIYPGISAFVGADITAGLCALNMGQGPEVRMLIDLGTNGEMVLGNEERLLATSVAAGPAFEGGCISCGTGSIPGAICGVRMWNGQTEVKTIGDCPPIGICGTGVIETVAELVENGIVDETGRMEEAWFENGFPMGENTHGEEMRFTQKDVREIQLAKAAVAAGIRTLLERYGIDADHVERIYVAGGFGYRLDYEKAQKIGLFPAEFAGKIEAVGNSALYGAVRLLLNPKLLAKAEQMAEMAEEVSLSADPVFQEAYMDEMLFEKDIC